MDDAYFSSLLELWGLDGSEIECSTLLNTATNWAKYTQREEVDKTAECASVAAAKTTAVSVGSVYGDREERASCRVALGEVAPKEGRKGRADVTTERKQEQLPVLAHEPEGKVCVLEEDSGNELKEKAETLGQSLRGCTAGESWRDSVSGKVGVKGESLRCEIACPCCEHCNERGAHWCSNCGTALLLPLSRPTHATTSMNLSFRHEADSLSDYSGDIKSQSPSSSPCDVHVPGYFVQDIFDAQNLAQESTLDFMAEISSNQKGITGLNCRESGKCSEHSYLDVKTSQIHETQGRHWSTSRRYHWRKPSSLKPVVISPLRKLKQSTVSQDVIHHVSLEDSGNIRTTTSVSTVHVPIWPFVLGNVLAQSICCYFVCVYS